MGFKSWHSKSTFGHGVHVVQLLSLVEPVLQVFINLQALFWKSQTYRWKYYAYLLFYFHKYCVLIWLLLPESDNIKSLDICTWLSVWKFILVIKDWINRWTYSICGFQSTQTLKSTGSAWLGLSKVNGSCDRSCDLVTFGGLEGFKAHWFNYPQVFLSVGVAGMEPIMRAHCTFKDSL